jgi:signal transduction histidine kinase
MSPGAAYLLGVACGGLAVGLAAWALHRRWTERRGRLIAFALHEINTPATAANLTLVNLLDGLFGGLTEAQSNWARTARDQIGRLSAVAGDLRDLVHLELLGRLQFNEETCPAAEIVETALNVVRGAYAHASIPLEESIELGLPEVRTDAERAARTLAGLLYHARKFRARGPVVLRARSIGGVVLCEIEYETLPTSPADAAASLDLYYPARRRTDQILSATGLGLGLSRELMRRGGGDVGFTVEGARARLTLSLPANA